MHHDQHTTHTPAHAHTPQHTPVPARTDSPPAQTKADGDRCADVLGYDTDSKPEAKTGTETKTGIDERDDHSFLPTPAVADDAGSESKQSNKAKIGTGGLDQPSDGLGQPSDAPMAAPLHVRHNSEYGGPVPKRCPSNPHLQLHKPTHCYTLARARKRAFQCGTSDV